MIGFGDKDFTLAIYIENPPPLAEYQSLKQIRPLDSGEIQYIADTTGNHWRKIFNVFAKLVYPLWAPNQPTWQAFRDQSLLQQGSRLALLFDAPKPGADDKQLHLIAGKTYAEKLGFSYPQLADTQPKESTCIEGSDINHHFAIHPDIPLIIIPYLDYRQLSNKKIELLQEIIKHKYHPIIQVTDQ